VSTGNTKTAREVYTIASNKLREKTELTKEEKRKERANKKRKIKTHLKNKEVTKKEHKRELGVAMLTDRFNAKDVNRKKA
jgi:hypothetical protein